MKRFLSIITIIVLFCSFFLFGCSRFKPKDNQIFKIATSFYPLQIAVLNLIDDVDNIESVNITQNHSGCIHNFSLKSEDMKSIEESKALIINGIGMEQSFLQNIIEKSPKTKIIDSSLGIEPLKNEDEAKKYDDHKEDHNHENEYNPHIWLSIKNHIKQVKNIASSLSEIFPQHSNKINENKNRYIKKLEQLDEISVEIAKNKNSKKIIAYHPIFSYLLEPFGISTIFNISNSHNSEISAKKIIEIIEFIKENNIKYMFTDSDLNKEGLFDLIIKETKINLINLNPISSGPADDGNYYLDSMKYNLEKIREVLEK